MTDLKIPEGIIQKKVRYVLHGVNGNPLVAIPTRTEDSRQAREIAELLTKYASAQTGVLQEPTEIADELFKITNSQAAPSSPLNLNYRVFYDTSRRSELIRATVYIFTESGCALEPKTLEAFVKDVILQ